MRTLPFKPFALRCINISEMEEHSEHRERSVSGTGFTVPSGYFDGLTDEINARISVERLKMLVPQDSGFTVPDAYFERLEASIAGKISQKPVFRLWRSGVLKYATAACFIIIAAAGILFFNTGNQEKIPGNSHADIAAEQILFDIDEDVIIEHIEANYKEDKKTNTADMELENYILNNYSQNDLASIL